MVYYSVTAIMPTYNRVGTDKHLIEEALYWFTRQEYEGQLKLIILNDAARFGQTIRCDVKGVTVVNSFQRFPTLGAKYNALVALCNTDIILPWEDDDISLPWRVQQSVLALQGYDYWNPKAAYFQVGKDGPLSLCSPHSVHHNTSGYKRSVFDLGVRYAEDTYGGVRQDAMFDQTVRTTPGVKISPCKFEPPCYVYRWQLGNAGISNLSGYNDPYTAYVNQARPVVGNFNITPTMGRDYASEVASCNSESPCSQ